MKKLIILSWFLASVYSQYAELFRNIPAILDSQARIVEAYYGTRGSNNRGSSGNPSSGGFPFGSAGDPGVPSGGGFPFGSGFPFNALNNPAIQNYVQGTLNNALQQSPLGYMTNPQNNVVNPSNYRVNPQSNNYYPQNNPAPASRRPAIKYPDVKNSLNNVNSNLKNIKDPGGGGLNFPFSSLFGR